MPHSGRRRISRIPTLGLCLLAGFAYAQDAQLRESPPVDPGILASKIAEVEASTTLDEGAAATRIDLYRRALTNLERAHVEISQAEAFASTGAGAPDKLAAVLLLSS